MLRESGMDYREHRNLEVYVFTRSRWIHIPADDGGTFQRT